MRFLPVMLSVAILAGGIPCRADEERGVECRPPLKLYKAFVVVKAVEAPERQGWELLGPGGDTPDLLDCSTNQFRPVEIVNGQTRWTNYHFKSRQACESALAILKKSTQQYPVVVVIGKDCVAQLADR